MRVKNSSVAPPRNGTRLSAGSSPLSSGFSKPWPRAFRRLNANRCPTAFVIVALTRRRLLSWRKLYREICGIPNSTSQIAASAVDLPASFGP